MAEEAPVRFSVCNELFGDTSLEEVCKLASELGYEGVELAPFTLADSVRDLSPEARRAIVETAERHGLEISALHWLLVSPKGLHITTPDEEVRNRTFSYLCDLVEFAGDLGASAMVLGSPKQRSLLPDQDRDEAMHAVAEGLKRVGEVAARRGVRFCLEALHPQETNFLNTIEEVLELLQLVGNPAVTYMLDVKAMSGMPSPIEETIKRYGGGSGHFHANEPSGKGPGMGSFSFGPIMQALVESGYRGWVSVEPFDYSPDPVTVARSAIETLKRALPA